MENQKKLITVAEFAKIYGLKQAKAYQLTRAKGFPCIRIGRIIHIYAADVEPWLKKNYGNVIK